MTVGGEDETSGRDAGLWHGGSSRSKGRIGGAW